MVDTTLDMRMSPAHQRQTAADIVNSYPEKTLADIFYNYGEEPFGRQIARALVAERKTKKILTTLQLVHLVSEAIPRSKHPRHINPATKVFQALRIEVNQELENITLFLKSALQFLKKDGRIVCISFHSLEDRIVKNFFREHTQELEILTSKPATPTIDEIARNASARSAKLRAAQKTS